MKFRFETKTNDQDYIDYNVFNAVYSPYGRKTIQGLRIWFSILTAIVFAFFLIGNDLSIEAFLSTIPILFVSLILQIFLKKFCALSIKYTIKGLKKSGKMGYSPESVIEFYEDYFIETTPENKTEVKFSAIEKVSVFKNKVIYIHINNVMAYILPFSSFESTEQYDAFFEFIKAKCNSIDIY